MSYDLAVWEGPMPVDDAAAAKHWPQLASRLESNDREPATPAIAAYVDALLAVWPDLNIDNIDDSPWTAGPLIGEANGSLIYFGINWEMAQEVSAFAADLARQHGLVCYDPQTEKLRP